MKISDLLKPQYSEQIKKDIQSMPPNHKWEAGIELKDPQLIIDAIDEGYWPGGYWPARENSLARGVTLLLDNNISHPKIQKWLDSQTPYQLYVIGIEYSLFTLILEAVKKGYNPTDRTVGLLYKKFTNEDMEKLNPYLENKFADRKDLSELSPEEREKAMTDAWMKIMNTGLFKSKGSNRQWKNGTLSFTADIEERESDKHYKEWKADGLTDEEIRQFLGAPVYEITKSGYIRKTSKDGARRQVVINPKATYEELADKLIEYIEKKIEKMEKNKLVSENLEEILDEFAMGPNIDMHEEDEGPQGKMYGDLEVILLEYKPQVFGGENSSDVFSNFYEVRKDGETLFFVNAAHQGLSFKDPEGNDLLEEEVMEQYPELDDRRRVNEDHVPYSPEELEDEDLSDLVDSIDLETKMDFLQTIYDKPIDYEYVAQNPGVVDNVLWKGLRNNDFSMDELVDFSLDLPSEMTGREDDDDMMAY